MGSEILHLRPLEVHFESTATVPKGTPDIREFPKIGNPNIVSKIAGS